MSGMYISFRERRYPRENRGHARAIGKALNLIDQGLFLTLVTGRGGLRDTIENRRLTPGAVTRSRKFFRQEEKESRFEERVSEG